MCSISSATSTIKTIIDYVIRVSKKKEKQYKLKYNILLVQSTQHLNKFQIFYLFFFPTFNPLNSFANSFTSPDLARLASFLMPCKSIPNRT